jgi:hypothetical protein
VYHSEPHPGQAGQHGLAIKWGDTGDMPHRQQSRTGQAVQADVASGVAELVADADRPRAWTLLVDGIPQSHVDLDDPEYLEF